MYAVVAVDMTIRQKFGLLTRRDDDEPGENPLVKTFHYRIPDNLLGSVDVGHLVWVPFGRQHRQGIVVDFDNEAPVPAIKPLDRLASDEPMLQPYQIDLAFWISREYHAPLWDTLALMLPPGIVQGTERWVHLIPQSERTATDHTPTRDERRALAWLRAQSGEAPIRDLERLIGSKRRTKKLVGVLEEAGIVTTEEIARRPSVQPRTERFVTLIVNPARLRARFRTLGRVSRKADALEWLAATPDNSAELDDLCEGAGCSQQHVRDLVDAGYVTRTDAQSLVQLSVPAAEALSALSSRAHKQSAIVEWLADQEGPESVDDVLDAVDSTHSPLRALEQKGIVESIEMPAHVHLNISRRQINRLAMEWRSSETYWRILNFLVRNPTEMTDTEIRNATDATSHHLEQLAEAGLIHIEEREVFRTPLAERIFAPADPPDLTPEQEQAWAQLRPAIRASSGEVFVLHGVTGSGKTELYLRAVDETLQRGKQAVILVPEISLTPQTVARFGARFGQRIALQHSRLSAGERFDEWRRLRDGHADVAIGSRSASFAPIPSPGLIVIDEEHEWTYKQEGVPGMQLPHYHARDVAARVARLTGATVILGSATPSLEAYERARRGQYRLIQMQERVVAHTTPQDHFRLQTRLSDGDDESELESVEQLAGALPPVHVVDLRAELKAGNTSIFSRELARAVASALAADHQVMLFLNRRGSNTFVMCRDCGWVPTCDRCDLPFTYHAGSNRLSCHQCNRHAAVPTVCTQCMSPRIKHFGIGTEQVEAMTHERFPGARTLRWDRDTAGDPDAHERILHTFAAGQADILIGTQMIAKGLDLPLVTVVGVVTADTGLHLPDFRAAERTFQLLTQVAGRAGRSMLGGRVIIQTYTPQHYAILAAAGHDYERFFSAEMTFRREHAYPPVSRLVKLTITKRSADEAEQAAQELAQHLRLRVRQLGVGGTAVLGPAPAFFGRLRGRYRWHLFIRGEGALTLLQESDIPFSWEVDVDPLNVLS